MDYLTKLLKESSEKKGGDKELAASLGVSRTTISDVRGQRRGLPLEACYKLAEMTGADLARVIAASEAITAKKPEEVKFWKKKLIELERLAACVAVATVANFVTPSPAQAAPVLKQAPELCILCQMLRRAIKKARGLFADLASDNPTTWTPPAGSQG